MNRIRMVTPDGRITTVAGSGATDSGDGGTATAAGISGVFSGIAVDAQGNLFLTTATGIRKVSNGIITTVAGNGTAGYSGDGGPATSAQFSPAGNIAIDSSGNLYVVDNMNCVRKNRRRHRFPIRRAVRRFRLRLRGGWRPRSLAPASALPRHCCRLGWRRLLSQIITMARITKCRTVIAPRRHSFYLQ